VSNIEQLRISGCAIILIGVMLLLQPQPDVMSAASAFLKAIFGGGDRHGRCCGDDIGEVVNAGTVPLDLSVVWNHVRWCASVEEDVGSEPC